MDTITHGIAGALVGKAFFATGGATAAGSAASAEVSSALKSRNRVAVAAATLGALFPDSDSLYGLFDSSGLAVISTHRAETHSLLCLPLFALALAGLTLLLCRRFRISAPPFRTLVLIYAAGIALHIFLDYITSFGTMLFAPLSYRRYSWDLAFIIDFTMTGIVLLPQVAAWVYRRPRGSRMRALAMWAVFTQVALGVQWLARANRLEFSSSVLILVSALLAALFFLPGVALRRADAPAVEAWGFRLSRAAWCRAGAVLLAVYLGCCELAHRAALRQVREFAVRENLRVEALGALPMPPWLGHWSGLIRAHDGVYFAPLHLFSSVPPRFEFFPDSPSNAILERVRARPEARLYFHFARFPRIVYEARGGLHFVHLEDFRFFGRRSDRPAPFTFRFVVDDQGRVLSQNWLDD